MSDPKPAAEPQAVPEIPDDTLTPCPHCKGVGSWAGTAPRGVCGQTITPCSYCAATGLRYPEERITRLESELREVKREGWISVDERLPAYELPAGFSEPVAIYPNITGCGTAFFGTRVQDKQGFYLHGALVEGVTHWQPLPEPPAKPAQGEQP